MPDRTGYGPGYSPDPRVSQVVRGNPNPLLGQAVQLPNQAAPVLPQTTLLRPPTTPGAGVAPPEAVATRPTSPLDRILAENDQIFQQNAADLKRREQQFQNDLYRAEGNIDTRGLAFDAGDSFNTQAEGREARAEQLRGADERLRRSQRGDGTVYRVGADGARTPTQVDRTIHQTAVQDPEAARRRREDFALQRADEERQLLNNQRFMGEDPTAPALEGDAAAMVDDITSEDPAARQRALNQMDEEEAAQARAAEESGDAPPPAPFAGDPALQPRTQSQANEDRRSAARRAAAALQEAGLPSGGARAGSPPEAPRPSRQNRERLTTRREEAAPPPSVTTREAPSRPSREMASRNEDYQALELERRGKRLGRAQRAQARLMADRRRANQGFSSLREASDRAARRDAFAGRPLFASADSSYAPGFDADYLQQQREMSAQRNAYQRSVVERNRRRAAEDQSPAPIPSILGMANPSLRRPE